jgi:hypothetical protein
MGTYRRWIEDKTLDIQMFASVDSFHPVKIQLTVLPVTGEALISGSS